MWANWKCKRGISAKPADRSKKDRDSDGKKKAQTDIGKFFNTKSCKNQSDKECKTPLGRTLRHVCNKYLAGGKVCQKDHSRAEHV